MDSSDEVGNRPPVPTTVSPEMQKLIGAPPNPRSKLQVKTIEQWKPIVEAGAATLIAALPAICERRGVKYEKANITGVRTFRVTPREIPAANQDRLLIHLHGGCYVMQPGEAALGEALLMAGFGSFKVISVDYRMPPEAYFPAALDDALAVWKAAVETSDPRKMAVFGTSAGGALTLALVARARAEGLPLPAAIASGTPMSDATKTGDTFYTNEGLDNVLVSRDGFCDAATRLYANGADLADPRLSPVYEDFRNYPPTILTSGTRDLLLSNTVRVHRKLRQAGVEADLHVYEGQSHAQYLFNDLAPEAAEAFGEIAAFFDKHLER
jgi:monoterpene epsilon-lactone hydrolase